MSKKSKNFRYADDTPQEQIPDNEEDYKELDKGKEFTGGKDSSIESSPSTSGGFFGTSSNKGGE